MKTCDYDDHVPYEHVYIVVQWLGPCWECPNSQVRASGGQFFLFFFC